VWHWEKAVLHCQQARDLTEEASPLGLEARMKLTQVVAGRDEKTWQAVIDGKMSQVIDHKQPGCVTPFTILSITLISIGYTVYCFAANSVGF